MLGFKLKVMSRTLGLRSRSQRRMMMGYGVYLDVFYVMYPVHILQLDYDSNFNFPSKPRMTNGEEPQVIAEWRRNQAERIRAKDEEEEMRKKEMRERAKKDLED